MKELSLERKKRINKVVAQRQADIIVVLEDIYNPHNAEAIFRTCDAFGIQNVYLIFEKQTPFEPQNVGKLTSSSANKWLSFKIFSTTETCIKELQENAYQIYATSLSDKAQSIFDLSFENKKIALLFGNEHAGLSPTALKMANFITFIPMKGMVQSLNLSVSAALYMFEVTRQRLRGKFNYSLDNYEQSKLQQIFINKHYKNES
jgi:tRNA (guanosine-2'-O-)-methyltransferase